MKRPIVVYAGQGLSLADRFNLTQELRWLKGHCFVEVDEPWNLDRVLVVLRDKMTEEQYRTKQSYLYDVLRTLDRLCAPDAYEQRMPKLETTSKLCERLARLAEDRLVVLFTSNIDCVARYEAVGTRGARWMFGTTPSGLSDWNDISAWLSTIASRASGFHYVPLHGEAGLFASGDGGTTYATGDRVKKLPDVSWGYTTGEGLGRNVTMIEQRMHISQAGYRLLRALLGGAAFDPTLHNEVATDPNVPPAQRWPLVRPSAATAAHLLLVGYGAGHEMDKRQYPLELSLDFVRGSLRGVDPDSRWTAIVGPDGNGQPWLTDHDFSVLRLETGTAKDCAALVTKALDELEGID